MRRLFVFLVLALSFLIGLPAQLLAGCATWNDDPNVVAKLKAGIRLTSFVRTFTVGRTGAVIANESYKFADGTEFTGTADVLDTANLDDMFEQSEFQNALQNMAPVRR